MPTTPHKLLLVDGLNLIRRVYEANLAPDSTEKAQGALRSSLSSFNRALREHAPTHCLWAFDAGGPTWRHVLYPAYKAARKPMPTFLKDELVPFKESLAQNGWAMAEPLGFEADDALGSLAVTASEQGIEVVVLSTDKDLASLAAYPGVSVHDHFGNIRRDAEWCKGKFGVGPELILDWLALTGDAVDGIPGVEGVGAKTATKLLLDHGDLRGVLNAAVDLNIPGKVGARLHLQRDVAQLSRELTTLKLDLFKDRFDLAEFALGN